MKTFLLPLLLFFSSFISAQNILVDTILDPFNVAQDMAILANGDVAFSTMGFFDGVATAHYLTAEGEMNSFTIPGGRNTIGLVFDHGLDTVYFATQTGKVFRHDRTNNELILQWSLLPEGMETGFFQTYFFRSGVLYAFGEVSRGEERFIAIVALDVLTGEVTGKYMFTPLEYIGGFAPKDDDTFLATRVGPGNTELLVLDAEMNVVDSVALPGLQREIVYFSDDELYFTSEIEERHFISKGSLSGDIAPFWEANNTGRLALLRKGPGESILWADQNLTILTGNSILYHLSTDRELIFRGGNEVFPSYDLLADIHLDKNDDIVLFGNGNATDVGNIFIPYIGRIDNTTSTNLVRPSVVRVFPNPTTSDFAVDVPEGVQIENLQLFNAEGRLVKFFQQGDNFTLQGLPSGNYVFRLMTNDGGLLTGKVTKGN